MPHLGPRRKCHRRSWQMPQSRLRRGLLDIPLRHVRLQHDRGHGADAVSHHTHQVGPWMQRVRRGLLSGWEQGWGDTEGAEGPAQLLAAGFLAACARINDFGLSEGSVHQKILLSTPWWKHLERAAYIFKRF